MLLNWFLKSLTRDRSILKNKKDQSLVMQDPSTIAQYDSSVVRTNYSP